MQAQLWVVESRVWAQAEACRRGEGAQRARALSGNLAARHSTSAAPPLTAARAAPEANDVCCQPRAHGVWVVIKVGGLCRHAIHCGRSSSSSGGKEAGLRRTALVPACRRQRARHPPARSSASPCTTQNHWCGCSVECLMHSNCAATAAVRSLRMWSSSWPRDLQARSVHTSALSPKYSSRAPFSCCCCPSPPFCCTMFHSTA